jgi:4-diphosphocytidyl-2-C-methyl-D-erythritol kinase
MGGSLLKEKAYAKINLFLNVVNKRFDGYHDLEMIMVPVQLHDELTFSVLPSKEIMVESDLLITTKIEDNLVYRVAGYLQTKFSVDNGVKIQIKKRIPIAAGLAGGSADAAATIRGLNKLWKLGLSFEDMANIGLKFGSDVPFCVYNKPCIAKGRGEELLFLDTKLKLPILIVNPGIPISTKEVFSRVKNENFTERKITCMANAIYNKNIPLLIRELHNSLEPIAFKIEPKIKEIKQQMIRWGKCGALMSGSGASVFAIAEEKSTLKELSQLFDNEPFSCLTQTL